MARKVQVSLLDDIDGTAADETLRFGLDGVEYEVDLSAQHADELRAALAKYVLKGRRMGRGAAPAPVRTRGTSSPTRSARAQNQAIREWARGRGIELNDRGRIPRSIVEEYQAQASR